VRVRGGDEGDRVHHRALGHTPHPRACSGPGRWTEPRAAGLRSVPGQPDHRDHLALGLRCVQIQTETPDIP
jgi:hypothetical protein